MIGFRYVSANRAHQNSQNVIGAPVQVNANGQADGGGKQRKFIANVARMMNH